MPAHCAAGILSFLIKCPPVVKKAPIVVPLSGQILTVPGLSAGFSVHPPLAITVLGILDVLSRMEQRVAIKAVIDITGMRHIPSCDNAHERVILADAHFSSIRRARSSGWLPSS